MGERYGYRCFGNSVRVSDNSWETGLNGNDLIFGTSGSGKTRGYVLPNILRTKGSIVTIDSKNQLYRKTRDQLLAKGYRVELIDFDEPSHSTIGYNPLDFIGKEADGTWSSEDIRKICYTLIDGSCRDDSQPVWQHLAEGMAETYITFVMEACPEEEHTIDAASRYMNGLNREDGVKCVRYIRDGVFTDGCWVYEDDLSDVEDELKRQTVKGGTSAYPLGKFFYMYPESRSARLFRENIESVYNAEKMYSSIIGITNIGLHSACMPAVVGLNSMPYRISFRNLADEKTALFINVSDSDRSKDMLVSMFYDQMFDQLLRYGKTFEDSRLPVPVRIFMDDFAAGTKIDHFDRLISVIRSYDISVSVILQSMTQLYSIYGEAAAKTITNNCDHILYLGGQDLDTVRFIAEHADRTANSVMGLPLDKAILITRGQPDAVTIPNIYLDSVDMLAENKDRQFA